MTSRWWSDDDQLLAALSDAFRESHDVPPGFVAAGKAAYAWHNIDAELAALTYDSATDGAGQRSTATTRTRVEPAPLRALTYASRGLRIHLEVGRNVLQGQVIPAQPGEIELRSANGPATTVTVDKVGWFTIKPTPTGPFRLYCRVAGGGSVITDWITL